MVRVLTHLCDHLVVTKRDKQAVKRIFLLVATGMMMAGWAHAEQSPIRFISHRGESYDAPENTMAAFRLAVARQTAGFECDVYLTADNEIVCIHDTTTTRTADGSLTVASSTLAQLKELDAGSWKGAQFVGERIPPVGGAHVGAGRMEIYVEIKCGTELCRVCFSHGGGTQGNTRARGIHQFQQFGHQRRAPAAPAYHAYWLTGISGWGAPSPSAASAIATMQSNGATSWTPPRMRCLMRRMSRRSRMQDSAFMSGPSMILSARRSWPRWVSRLSRLTAVVISRRR